MFSSKYLSTIATITKQVDDLAEKVLESYKLTRTVILEYQARIDLMRNCTNCAWSVEGPVTGDEGFCQLPLICMCPQPCKDKCEWRERYKSLFDSQLLDK